MPLLPLLPPSNLSFIPLISIQIIPLDNMVLMPLVPLCATHRFAEWQCDLPSHHVEEVGWGCCVAHEPVDVVQLLNLKVLVHRLWEKHRTPVHSSHGVSRTTREMQLPNRTPGGSTCYYENSYWGHLKCITDNTITIITNLYNASGTRVIIRQKSDHIIYHARLHINTIS